MHTTLSVAGVYALRNCLNGHRYVGSAANLRARLNEHQYDLRNGCHPNRHLQRAWLKYGEAAFEFTVLELVGDLTELLTREQHWLDTLAPEYNILRRAGSPLGFRHTPEAIERMRRAQKGRRFTQEARALLSAALKGRPLSPETRQKMSETRQGVPRPPGSAAKSGASRRGTKHTPEARAKMSAAAQARKYRPCSEATRAKLADGKRRHYERLRAQPEC